MYMTVSSGIAMEIHYCMGEKAGVDFYNNPDDKCGRCGMKEQAKKGCCSDDHKFYKLEDSHQKAVNDYTANVGTDVAIADYAPHGTEAPAIGAYTVTNNHSPPDYLPRPARIMHGVFR